MALVNAINSLRREVHLQRVEGYVQRTEARLHTNALLHAISAYINMS